MKFENVLLCVLASAAMAGCAASPDIAQAPPPAEPVTVQILAINDFHGNLEPHRSPTTISDGDTSRDAILGGAARLGATLDNLRVDNSITVAAGDLIGASPLISSLFLDEPTIRVLSDLGLDVASVGNHEFDRGIPELRRMQDGGCEQFTRREACALEPFAGADFTYLAGNVVDADGNTLFPATAMREIGGVKIGFVGMTLEGTPDLVAAQATAGYDFLDEAETANRLAMQLRAEGADTVVVLIHEGADVSPRYNISGCPDLSGEIVPIVEALDPAISLVVSGHTHQAYVCDLTTVAGGSVLLTSGGRYGGFVTDITMQIDPADDRVLALSAHNVPVEESAGLNAAADAIVRRYAVATGPVANRPVGPISDSGEMGEDCGDRPAQDFVADAYLFAANAALPESVDLALVNSGGVRSDLAGADDGLLTFGELTTMSPFGNGLIVLEMTGAQIKTVLEQQFCGMDPAVTCDSVLIPSRGSSFAADLDLPPDQRVTAINIHGEPLDPTRTYRVVTNSFLVGGGDGFVQFGAVPEIANIGFDIDALEAYVASGAASVPVCGRVSNIPPAD